MRTSSRPGPEANGCSVGSMRQLSGRCPKRSVTSYASARWRSGGKSPYRNEVSTSRSPQLGDQLHERRLQLVEQRPHLGRRRLRLVVVEEHVVALVGAIRDAVDVLELQLDECARATAGRRRSPTPPSPSPRRAAPRRRRGPSPRAARPGRSPPSRSRGATRAISAASSESGSSDSSTGAQLVEQPADLGIGELLVREADERRELVGTVAGAGGRHHRLLVPGEEAGDLAEIGDLCQPLLELLERVRHRRHPSGLPFPHAPVAQWTERRTSNPLVGGSNPPGRIDVLAQMRHPAGRRWAAQCARGDGRGSSAREGAEVVAPLIPRLRPARDEDYAGAFLVGVVGTKQTVTQQSALRLWRRGPFKVLFAHHREHEAHHVVVLMVLAAALSLIATIFVAGAAGYVARRLASSARGLVLVPVRDRRRGRRAHRLHVRVPRGRPRGPRRQARARCEPARSSSAGLRDVHPARRVRGGHRGARGSRRSRGRGARAGARPRLARVRRARDRRPDLRDLPAPEPRGRPARGHALVDDRRSGRDRARARSPSATARGSAAAG